MPARPGYCFSCERFIGPSDHCPYCDTPAAGLLSLRILRFLALGTAILGLVLLAIFRHRLAIPTVPLADLQPAMHGARIRTTGLLSAPPRHGRSRSGQPWLRLTIEENGQSVRLVAQGKTAEAIQTALRSEESSPPSVPVHVVGRLQWRAGESPVLFVQKETDVIVGPHP